ncbi:MAG: DUF2461 domain-containing protein [Caulobacteraceae bacterium]
MENKNTGAFKGFSKEMLEFLISLKFNNSKGWFEEHREEYTRYVLEPFKSLVVELSSFMLELDPLLEVTPAVDKTISRIHRDIRFSKDKSPYRSNVWITFKRPQKDWKESPSWYFEITPDFYRYGMGFYTATKATMDRFRKRIDDRPEEFLEVISFYRKGTFSLEGESYKKILDSSKPKEIQEWYQKKNFYLACNRKLDKLLFEDELPDVIREGFSELVPLYNYLWDVKLEGETIEE